MKVRRSVLYMPAANSRALEKAAGFDADALIFDLEDAVAPDSKPIAREQAVAAVRSGSYGHRELTIRCNGLDTPWGTDDVAAASAAGPSAIVIPKVASAAHVDEITAVMDRAAASSNVKVWAMIETPDGIVNADEIAAHPRVDCFVMGTNDMAKELRAQLIPGRVPLVPHLASALLAARRHGISALDGVFNDVKDAVGFEDECVQGWQMGFDGKTLIHPAQLEPCNRVWSPTADDVGYARRVIEAFTEAQAEGRGVCTVDGRMIENLHVDNARLVLAVHDVIAART
ncbi:MAG: CoA ester lyase [Actinomycetia bacterium]|nr:CoA ester lyase [Actinomycetes bacterium]